ncbi:MAG: M1 family metallopeptidase [candidate division KSB1 bacterium]
MKRITPTLLFAVLFCVDAVDNSPLEGGQGGVAREMNTHIALTNSPRTPLKGGMIADDGYPRQPQFDVLHYDLALSLSDTSNVLWGQAKLHIKVRSAASAKNLRLDLKAMTITQIAVGQENAAFKHEQDVVEVALPATLAGGDTISVTLAYHGEPQDGLIIGNNKFGRRTMFADNWPDRARHWFPSLDHPSDKSSVAMQVTLPAHYTVIANGRLTQVREPMPGYKTWEWSEPVPIPTYCMVFGAADFAVIPLANQTLPISYYVYPEDAPHAAQNFGRVPAMLQFFTERFGAFPFAKLALVQSSTRYGGMENASAIFFAEKSLGPERNIESTTAHEIAHQWFGDSATEADWHHLWLSEGFATYGEALFFEHVDGVAALRENMRVKRANYFDFAARKPGPILDRTITDYMALLTPNNYAKAGWVLHMLRDQVGDEAFWRGVRNYYTRYQNRNALTQDFRAAMEEASGTALEWFFQQWFEQPDYPRVRAHWRWHAAAQQIELVLAQTQSESLYRLPLELEWGEGEARTKRQILMNAREQKFFLPAAREPATIVFDPEVKLLLTTEVVKGDKSD